MKTAGVSYTRVVGQGQLGSSLVRGSFRDSFLNPSSLLRSDLCGDVNRNERAQRATLRTQNQLSKWEPRKLPDIYICTYCTVHNSTRHRNGTLQALTSDRLPVPTEAVWKTVMKAASPRRA